MSSTCTATSLYGYVIGPKGEIYKCWEDVGIKEKEIGSVLDGKLVIGRCSSNTCCMALSVTATVVKYAVCFLSVTEDVLGIG